MPDHSDAPVERKLVGLYLRTVCRLVNKLVAGNTNATTALLATLRVRMDLEKLRALFQQKGITVRIEWKHVGSVIQIKSTKRTERQAVD
jgi:ubiquinone/menaquinone biosynthesis C-methylase UbiE